MGAGGSHAVAGDFELCRQLHRKHGTTYYFATCRFRPRIRRRVHALYGFVRVPDEWVDNPTCDPLPKLRAYREDLLCAFDGARAQQAGAFGSQCISGLGPGLRSQQVEHAAQRVGFDRGGALEQGR